jgi:hypothetical protein
MFEQEIVRKIADFRALGLRELVSRSCPLHYVRSIVSTIVGARLIWSSRGPCARLLHPPIFRFFFTVPHLSRKALIMTLRDRLSHLTFNQAVKLLGNGGNRLIITGG